MATRKQQKQQRKRSSHPGVVLFKRTHRGGNTSWCARYRDPDTGRKVDVTLDPQELSTIELRRDWATRKSRELTKRSMELEEGAPVRTESPLGASIDAYYETATIAASTLATADCRGKRHLNIYKPSPQPSWGQAVHTFLGQRGLGFLPKYEHHDALHVLLSYDTSVLGELRQQAFLVGNGTRTFAGWGLLLPRPAPPPRTSITNGSRLRPRHAQRSHRLVGDRNCATPPPGSSTKNLANRLTNTDPVEILANEAVRRQTSSPHAP